VLVAGLALYGLTANRGAQWQDSGWQQLRIVRGELEHPYGWALAHPLQHYLGRAAIYGLPIEPAFAITLVSAVAAAIAVANLAALLLLITRRRDAALIASTALALSHTFWQNATYTESYALVAALLTGEWLCLAYFVIRGSRRALLLGALLNGLGIANHLLAGLATLVDAGFLAWTLRKRLIIPRIAIACAACWLVGACPYLVPVLRALIQSGDASGTIHSALFGNYAGQVLNASVTPRMLVLAVGYVLYNFPGLTVFLAGCGLFMKSATTRSLRVVWTIQLLLFSVFVIRYSIADLYTYFFPIYTLLCMFAGLGLARILGSWNPRQARVIMVLAAITAIWTPIVYLVTSHVLESRGLLKKMVRNKPYRDGYRAFFLPWGCANDAGERVNRAVAAAAGEDGVVLVADHMIGFGIRYAQAVQELPASVQVLDIAREADAAQVSRWKARLAGFLLENRPVVLVPRDRDRPETCVRAARWRRVGDLYLLTTLESDDE